MATYRVDGSCCCLEYPGSTSLVSVCCCPNQIPETLCLAVESADCACWNYTGTAHLTVIPGGTSAAGYLFWPWYRCIQLDPDCSGYPEIPTFLAIHLYCAEHVTFPHGFPVTVCSWEVEFFVGQASLGDPEACLENTDTALWRGSFELLSLQCDPFRVRFRVSGTFGSAGLPPPGEDPWFPCYPTGNPVYVTLWDCPSGS